MCSIKSARNYTGLITFTTMMMFDAQTILAAVDVIMDETGMAQLPTTDRATAAIGVETVLHERVAAFLMRSLTADQRVEFRGLEGPDALAAFVTSPIPNAGPIAVQAVAEARR